MQRSNKENKEEGYILQKKTINYRERKDKNTNKE